MIKTENVRIGAKQFVRTYSNAGMMVHGGVPEGDYYEAYDPADTGRTYTETDIPIDADTNAEQILNILLGGDVE